jgi:HSP20 family protein
MDFIPPRLFDEPRSLREETDSLWNRLTAERTFCRASREKSMPLVDISETKESLLVKAELPGLEANDLNVCISGDLLTIKGENKKEKEETGEHYRWVERQGGSFQRSILLPVNVRGDKVGATFDKGVLTITVPKTAEAKGREIEVDFL